jgi:glycosyltransferase involved in cell wall biosynthesis
MKIALIVPGGVDRTGEVRVIPAFIALIRRLAARHELHVFALRQEDAPGTWRLAGATVHNAGRRHAAWRTVVALWAEHRREPFSLVHSLFSGKGAAIGRAFAAALRIPFAVHLTGGELKQLHAIRYGGSLSWSGRLRESVVLRGATAVSATSAPMIEDLSSLGVGAERIPLGADLTVWEPRQPRARSPGQPLQLIHVASLNRVKDQPTLLRALAEMIAQGHEFRLDVVGDDTLAGEIQSSCVRLGLEERVRFRGFLRQTTLRSLMAEADVCVVSSLHEAGPMVVLEAATLGIPTVGTRVGHIAEWSPRAAIAVPTGDHTALAAGLIALASDEQRRLALGQAALELAVEEDADFTARCFENLYSRLCRVRHA